MPAITAKPITATPITARPLTAYRLGESTDGAVAYDYYINGATGNDANDGLSTSTAWATLSKIGAIALPAGETKTVFVDSWTYDSADDYVIRNDASSGGAPGAGSILEITFGSGANMDGTAANAAAAGTNGFEFGGTNAWTATVYGNGLTVDNYIDAGGTTPNGIGNRNSHTLNVYDIDVTGGEDGVSGHDSSTINAYRCTFADCTKAAFAFVNSSVFYAENCTFTSKASATLGIGVMQNTSSGEFVNCDFVPIVSGDWLDFSNSTFTRCKIGTLTERITGSNSSGVEGVFTDCFLNLYIDGNNEATLTRCFGKFSMRTRSGGNINVSKSVFSAPASGQSSIVFANFDPGSASQIQFSDSIIESANAAAFMTVDATNAGYIVSAASEFFNNCLSTVNSIAYDADLVSADGGGTVIVDTLSDDPEIGAANTTSMADYAYSDTSPCIGSGTSSSNIGFGSSDVVAVGAA